MVVVRLSHQLLEPFCHQTNIWQNCPYFWCEEQLQKVPAIAVHVARNIIVWPDQAKLYGPAVANPALMYIFVAFECTKSGRVQRLWMWKIGRHAKRMYIFMYASLRHDKCPFFVTKNRINKALVLDPPSHDAASDNNGEVICYDLLDFFIEFY